jgi:hypothetical protein
MSDVSRSAVFGSLFDVALLLPIRLALTLGRKALAQGSISDVPRCQRPGLGFSGSQTAGGMLVRRENSWRTMGQRKPHFQNTPVGWTLPRDDVGRQDRRELCCGGVLG